MAVRVIQHSLPKPPDSTSLLDLSQFCVPCWISCPNTTALPWSGSHPTTLGTLPLSCAPTFMLPESKAPSFSSFYLICEQHLTQLTTLFWKHCSVSLWDLAFSGSPFASPAFWKRSLFQPSFLLWLFGLLWVSLEPQPLLHLPLWPRWLPQIPRHLF